MLKKFAGLNNLKCIQILNMQPIDKYRSTFFKKNDRVEGQQ